MSEQNNVNIFEQASRAKLRFETAKGLISAEDLWDLPLKSARSPVNLNDIAKAVNRKLKDMGDEEFVHAPNENSSIPMLTAKLQLDVIKHIIAVHQVEESTRAVAADRRNRKAKLLEILASKQDKQLEEKSVDELTAMIGEL